MLILTRFLILLMYSAPATLSTLVTNWKETHRAKCGLVSTSGFLHVPGRKSSALMFYWLFPNQSSDTVIMWLGGSMGCSAVGSLADIAGCDKAKSWTNLATLISVDPPGLGFSGERASRGGKPIVEQGCRGLANDLANFASHFVDANPQYKRKRWYVFGERAVGHCVGVVGHVFANSFSGTFAGIGIGNAGINTMVQVKSYPTFLVTSGVKIRLSKKHLVDCLKMIKKCNLPWPFGGQMQCVQARNACGQLYDDVTKHNRSVVDIDAECATRAACYGFGQPKHWVAKMKGLGLEPGYAAGVLNKQFSFRSCIPNLYRKATNFSLPVANFEKYDMVWSRHLLPLLSWATDMNWYLEFLLKGMYKGKTKRQYSVLLYAGSRNFEYNWYGMWQNAKRLQWPGQVGFDHAQIQTLKGRTSKSNLGEILVHDSEEGGRLAFARLYGCAGSPAREKPLSMKYVIRRFVAPK